jgi:hypothetical protein
MVVDRTVFVWFALISIGGDPVELTSYFVIVIISASVI